MTQDTKEHPEEIKPSEPVNFLAEGYSNYIAARILLNKRLFIEGHILAHYCLEKYIKGLLMIKGMRLRGHFITDSKFIEPLRKYFGVLDKWLSTEFIQYMERAFQLRYWDNQKEIGNIMLYRRRTLYHLDNTIQTIETALLKRPPGYTAQYVKDIERQEPALIEDNLAINHDPNFETVPYEEDVNWLALNDKFDLLSGTCTLSNHKYSTGFLLPGHIKFAPVDKTQETIIIPNRTYPKVKGG